MSQIYASSSLRVSDHRILASTLNLKGAALAHSAAPKRGKWRRLHGEEALRALGQLLPAPEPVAPHVEAEVIPFPAVREQLTAPVLPDLARERAAEVQRAAMAAESAKRRAERAIAAREMMLREEEEVMLLLLA